MNEIFDSLLELRIVYCMSLMAVTFQYVIIFKELSQTLLFRDLFACLCLITMNASPRFMYSRGNLTS